MDDPDEGKPNPPRKTLKERRKAADQAKAATRRQMEEEREREREWHDEMEAQFIAQEDAVQEPVEGDSNAYEEPHFLDDLDQPSTNPLLLPRENPSVASR